MRCFVEVELQQERERMTDIKWKSSLRLSSSDTSQAKSIPWSYGEKLEQSFIVLTHILCVVRHNPKRCPLRFSHLIYSCEVLSILCGRVDSLFGSARPLFKSFNSSSNVLRLNTSWTSESSQSKLSTQLSYVFLPCVPCKKRIIGDNNNGPFVTVTITRKEGRLLTDMVGIPGQTLPLLVGILPLLQLFLHFLFKDLR